MSSGILASKIYTKQELCLFEEKPKSCGIIIFGASGDLTHRKLIPALYELYEENVMPKDFYVVGVARTQMSDDDFRDRVKDGLKEAKSKDAADEFIRRFYYVTGGYDDPKTYTALSEALEKHDKNNNVQNRHVFYLSTPPSLYEKIIDQLGESGLANNKEKKDEWSRVVIEKPFGDSLISARTLNHNIRKVLNEDQIYRIDHFLGKETVQNILMFRFANILFEHVWNRNYINHIQITAAEKIGVGHRAGFYEQAGVFRDMFQNHLLQLLALTTMEPPTSMDADSVRDKRIDVFESIVVPKPDKIKDRLVFGQYGPGEVDGKKVVGYREEKEVAPKSKVPTFGAIRVELDNWRWQGVPIFIRSGKRLKEKQVEISVHFKRVPTSIFKPLLAEQLAPNVLKFAIQPDEGIRMCFEAKHPGPKLCMSTVTMDFGYKDTFGTPPPEAYSRLFLDTMLGDQTLFSRSDGVEEAWRVIDPFINYIEGSKSGDIPIYPAGSWGPKESDALVANDGVCWDN